MEHPAITRTLLTGYPEPVARVIARCPYCHRPFYEGDGAVYYRGRYYCDNDHLALDIGAEETEVEAN